MRLLSLFHQGIASAHIYKLIHFKYKGDLVSQDKREACLQDWMDREAIAESMIPLIGTLYRNKNVVTSVYGRDIINRSVIQLDRKSTRVKSSHVRISYAVFCL